MAFFRRGNWGYNPYKKWGSSSTKRRRGNFKAAKQTRDAMNFVIKCNYAFSAKYIPKDANNNVVEYGTAVINIYEVLRSNSQFSNFAALYDQIKVDGIKVKLNVADAATTAAQINAIKTINIVTAWDRTGISKDQVDFFDIAGDKIPEVDYDTSGANSFKYKIGKGIVNGTGNNKTILNNYQRWSSNPYLYPSTSEEKGCYLSTSNFAPFLESVNYNTCANTVNSANDATPISELFNNANPCIPFESPSCKWKPTLMVGVFKTGLDGESYAVDNYQECDPVVFNAEFTIDCKFRNMKASL